MGHKSQISQLGNGLVHLFDADQCRFGPFEYARYRQRRARTALSHRGNDVKLGEAGDNLMVWNNGDGSDLMALERMFPLPKCDYPRKPLIWFTFCGKAVWS